MDRSLLGTVTGRISSEAPTFINIRRDGSFIRFDSKTWVERDPPILDGLQAYQFVMDELFDFEAIERRTQEFARHALAGGGAYPTRPLPSLVLPSAVTQVVRKLIGEPELKPVFIK